MIDLTEIPDFLRRRPKQHQPSTQRNRDYQEKIVSADFNGSSYGEASEEQRTYENQDASENRIDLVQNILCREASEDMRLTRVRRKYEGMNRSKALRHYGLSLFVSIVLSVAAPLSPLRSQTDPRPSNSSVAVIDGDTLEVDGGVVQLFGIDAPELGQSCPNNGQTWPCGLNAAFALKKILDVERRPVSCRFTKEEKVMPAAICTVGHVDLAEQLLLDGYAVAMDKSLPGYQEAQRNAQQAHLGIWRGQFVTPGDWRLGKRVPRDAARADGVCFVKGVVEPQGRRTYYVPTDDEYDQIDVDRDKGERCFASDDLARDAGWRRRSEQRRLTD